jgi:hypothetical protein
MGTGTISTCGHCGESVRLAGQTFEGAPVWWTLGEQRQRCYGEPTLHTVDLSHASSHMSDEG